MPRYLGALLFIAMCKAVLAADSTVPCEDTSRIDLFAIQIDARLKRMTVRTFAETFSLRWSTWHEVKTPGEGAGTVASVYFDNNIPVAAFFTIQTESGDWVLFADYYFRPDGSLAKRHERLNTFYGNVSVLRDTYLGCHGEEYRGTTRYLDLKTQQPKEASSDFIDQRAPLFKRVQNLPFDLKQRN